MISAQQSTNDPLDFVRSLWGNMGFSLPGMVAPTFDTDELEKRITDLKAVEGWLRMNLSMLQMTIQGLEMQKTTLTAVKAMGAMAARAAEEGSQQAATGQGTEATAAAAGALSEAAMWPWNMMQQLQDQLQQQTEAVTEPATAAPAKPQAAPTRKAGKQ